MPVRGPIGATIATLQDANWTPNTPTKWLSPGKTNIANFMHEPGISKHQVLYEFAERIEAGVWKEAASSHNGAGLELGTPQFTPLSKAYSYLIKHDHFEEAIALETLLTNRCWSGERKLQSGIMVEEEEATCDACGELETDLHKHYQCKVNRSIQHWAVSKTNQYKDRAAEEQDNKCLWHRGILPASMTSGKVGWIDSESCQATVRGEFDELLRRTKTAGSDGGANESSQPHTRTAAAGAAVVDKSTREVAILFSQVPGPQTVPRAELWALYHVLARMEYQTMYTVYIDAQYVVNGMISKSSHYAQGLNGDLWTKFSHY